jgi:hypothetical protein
MKQNQTRMIQGRRLTAVRKAAGFKSAREAALECGWPESTYRAHENGSRTIGQDDAIEYVARFKSEGAKGYTAQWVLFGDGAQPDESLDEMIRGQSPEMIAKVYQAVRLALKK